MTTSDADAADDAPEALGDALEAAEDPDAVASVFDRPGRNPAHTTRPSLVRLVEDVREVLAELMRGFTSRRAVLEWAQRLAVRTLGEVDQRVYRELGRQYRSVVPGAVYRRVTADDRDLAAAATAPAQDRVLLSALLRKDARDRDLAEARALELRRRLAATYVLPATHRAFRELRTDAGEYLDDAREAEHDPLKQRYIAMRPALDELDERQADTLGRCLDGFDSREDILEWGAEVELATHGEVAENFARRAYSEDSTAALLLSDSDTAARGRLLFAAVHLVPTFNRGVRVLAGRAGEQAHEQKEDTERTVA